MSLVRVFGLRKLKGNCTDDESCPKNVPVFPSPGFQLLLLSILM